MNNPYLVSFDTDRIKDYVFATDKLREIRGASQLLNDLNDGDYITGVIQSICPAYTSIFFGGGSGAVLVPTQGEAEAIISAVEDAYRQTTFTASLTGVALPLSPATETSGFGQRMEVAGLRLRQAKDEKARRTAMTIEPYTQPCSACERYPATRESPVDRQPVCDSCNAKRERERQRKIAEDETARTQPNWPRLPEELSDLGDYIGFIYADGNNMGDWLGKMDRLTDYTAFAVGLKELIENCVNQSLQRLPHGDLWPFDKLLIGGDDLMLVTAGDNALQAALDIAQRFENGSRGLLQRIGLPADQPLTLGVGVVLAHASFPIAAFQRLASQLLKRAKQRCAKEQYQISALDFMVVTAAGSSDVSTLRDEALTQQAFVFPHSERQVRLTQRPYTVTEAEQLLADLKAFKRGSFPRSQLQFLYEGLFHSQVEAIYRWGKVAGRVKKEHRALMDDFMTHFGDATAGLPPWRTDYGAERVFTSALGDLVEVYPFVQVDA